MITTAFYLLKANLKDSFNNQIENKGMKNKSDNIEISTQDKEKEQMYSEGKLFYVMMQHQ